uniref:DUF3506 domain-containing protein n=1 Tax=Macrostomum lignano TaxID=282301 RepID=A0A1I8F838_9PLAT
EPSFMGGLGRDAPELPEGGGRRLRSPQRRRRSRQITAEVKQRRDVAAPAAAERRQVDGAAAGVQGNAAHCRASSAIAVRTGNARKVCGRSPLKGASAADPQERLESIWSALGSLTVAAFYREFDWAELRGIHARPQIRPDSRARGQSRLVAARSGGRAPKRGGLLARLFLARDEAVKAPLRVLETRHGDVATFRGRPYSDKMRWDKIEMLYWLQEERRRPMESLAEASPRSRASPVLPPITASESGENPEVYGKGLNYWSESGRLVSEASTPGRSTTTGYKPKGIGLSSFKIGGQARGREGARGGKETRTQPVSPIRDELIPQDTRSTDAGVHTEGIQLAPGCMITLAPLYWPETEHFIVDFMAPQKQIRAAPAR